MRHHRNAPATLVFLFFIVYGLNSKAQSTNSCGLVARISPAAQDSIVPVNTLINFTSNSINATSVKWYLDGFYSGVSSNSFNYTVGAGSHKISLIATNGTCSDTATVFYFSIGTPHNIDSSLFANYGLFDLYEYGTSVDAVAGSFVIGGYGSFYGRCGNRGLVVKLRDKGCIEWSKEIRDDVSRCGANYGAVNGICFSASDGSYYILGSAYLMKMDGSGNQLWAKKIMINGSNTYFTPKQITVDPSGNVYVMGQSMYFGWMVTKLNTSGIVLWSKYYHVARQNPALPKDFTDPAGMVWMNDKLYVTGRVSDATTGKAFEFLTRIDALTGNTDWQYGYETAALPNSLSFSEPSSFGNWLMVAGSDGAGETLCFIDNQGLIRKSIKVQFNTSYAPKVSKAVADNSGNIYMMQMTEQSLNVSPYSFYYTNFAKIDTSLNKYWGMVYPESEFNDISIGSSDFAALGSEYGQETTGTWGSVNMRFIKIGQQTSSINNSCNYATLNYNLSPVVINRISFNWGMDSLISINALPLTQYTVADLPIQSRYTCPDFLDSCSFLKISGPTTLCGYNNSYTYQLHRNRRCSLLPQWKLPSGVTIKAQTDSSITLQFSGFGVYTIVTEVKSCITVADSLKVVILPRTGTLDLGKDTVLCDQPSWILHAGKQFVSYQWQDGSRDSVFTVTKSGLYWAQVIDSCGNSLRDSIRVQMGYGILVNAGADRTKCNEDTLHLSATPGLLSYEWSNNYAISSLTSADVVVNPLMDTAYYLKAEKLPGCFAYDTVKITVRQSPAINLGPDTSFCAGSIVLDAGSGFQKYVWNNGAASSRITVTKSGTYSVTGITAVGCKSYDTVRVDVLTNPIVRLDHTSTLCTGTTRMLDAGSFSSYLWNDGSVSRTRIVRNTGTYYVDVTDDHGCKGSDTAKIISIVPLPADFLPKDTAICPSATLQLQPTKRYASYLWSSGESAPTIIITSPGTYWLQVSDAGQCTGRDTIVVNPKDCAKGVFIPTAFTPNGDGKNDLLKPMANGNLKKYLFTVYNRWGQMIFQTSELNKGWDGTVNGSPQPSGVFVWICSYQFDGESPKQDKGTVILIR